MTCPKCQGAMRTYERNGVHIDQCSDCRGLFLDRGELERLVEAEGSFYQQQPAAARQEQPAAPRQEQRHDHYEVHGKSYKKRRKNFLEELFE